MTFSTSAVAACCSRPSFSSRVSRAISDSWLTLDELLMRMVFGALRRFSAAGLLRCVLVPSPPALERRLLPSPSLRARHRSGSNWQAGSGQNGAPQCPLYPRKRTSELNHGMSALCQKRTFAGSFDHLVGPAEQRVPS